MTRDDLKKACFDFEREHGVEAFLDAMAEIMSERMAEQGLQLSFFDDDKDIGQPAPGGESKGTELSRRPDVRTGR